MIQALAPWLLSLAWPLVRRVLLALGIGAVSYAGLSALFSIVQGHVVQQWGAMPTAVLQLATLSGFTDAVGITLGALAARVTLVAVGKLGILAK